MTFLCDIDFLLLCIFITSEGFFQTGELSITVNSEIFVRVLYSRKFFVKIKSSQNAKITLSFTDIGKSCPSSDFLMSQFRKYVF